MPKSPDLRETLKQTRDRLKDVRKGISEAGHVSEMQEIDSLVGVAKDEAERMLKSAEMAEPAEPLQGVVAADATPAPSDVSAVSEVPPADAVPPSENL
jgi:hypothetical protein